MDKTSITERIAEDLIFHRWGTTKLIKVIGLSLIGASVGAVVGTIMIPDDPNNIVEEKEN